MKPGNKLFGLKMRSVRQHIGLSQKDIAKELGLSSTQFVSNVERGLCYYAPSMAKSLNGILKVNPAHLVKFIFKCKCDDTLKELKLK